MKIKLIVLSSLLLIMIACQAEDTTETDPDKNSEKSEEAFQESEPEEMEQTLNLPDENQVKTLPHILNKLSYSIEETGAYDQLTTWAVTDLQLQKNLSVSGIYNTETKDILEEMLEEEMTISTGSTLAKPDSADEYPEVI